MRMISPRWIAFWLALVLYVAGSIAGAIAEASSSTSDQATSIELRDIEFQPSKIKVEPGATLEFTNDDPFEHDVYIVDAADPNHVVLPARLLGPGESFVVPAQDEKALYSVYCTIHGGMQAQLTTGDRFELTADQQARKASQPTLPPVVAVGEEIFWGRGMCHQCHRMGDRGTGLRGPDLRNVGLRSQSQADRQGLATGTDYLVKSILDPSSSIVAGYSNDMPNVYEPPIDLGQKEIEAVVAYLQSQGGTVDTWAIKVPAERLDPPASYNPFAGGDPTAGERVFFEVASCNSCHQIGDKLPISSGPDLTEIGAFRDWRWLAESILHPNAEVGANWHGVTILLKSWDTVSGLLQRKTAEQLEVLVSQNRTEMIKTEEIDSIEIEEGSRMAANYGELLTVDQLRDLVTYLQSLGERALEAAQGAH